MDPLELTLAMCQELFPGDSAGEKVDATLFMAIQTLSDAVIGQIQQVCPEVVTGKRVYSASDLTQTPQGPYRSLANYFRGAVGKEALRVVGMVFGTDAPKVNTAITDFLEYLESTGITFGSDAAEILSKARGTSFPNSTPDSIWREIGLKLQALGAFLDEKFTTNRVFANAFTDIVSFRNLMKAILERRS